MSKLKKLLSLMWSPRKTIREYRDFVHTKEGAMRLMDYCFDNQRTELILDEFFGHGRDRIDEFDFVMKHYMIRILKNGDIEKLRTIMLSFLRNEIKTTYDSSPEEKDFGIEIDIDDIHFKDDTTH